MLYYIRVSNSLATRNKYQSAVSKLVNRYDHVLLENPAEFINNLARQVEAIHGLYPRCAALKLSKSKLDNAVQYDFSDFIYFKITPIAGKYDGQGVVNKYIAFHTPQEV